MKYPRARRLVASLEVTALYIGSFVPSNSLRKSLLRVFGAKVGLGVAIHHGIRVRAARRLIIADDVWIGEGVAIDARGGVAIGKSTSVGDFVQIISAQHDWRATDFRYTTAPVDIGHHCWINSRSIIIPGTNVGDGSVIGAGAVVTRDTPPWTLNVGTPARVIADRPQELNYSLEAAERKLYWW